jgi:hypothetical protein
VAGHRPGVAATVLSVAAARDNLLRPIRGQQLKWLNALLRSGAEPPEAVVILPFFAIYRENDVSTWLPYPLPAGVWLRS